MVLPGLEGENGYNREYAAAKLRQAQIGAWDFEEGRYLKPCQEFVSLLRVRLHFQNCHQRFGGCLRISNILLAARVLAAPSSADSRKSTL